VGLCSISVWTARFDIAFDQFIAFEFESQLTRIDSYAFSNGYELRSTGLARSVEAICANAFSGCPKLLLFTFEGDSKLTRIKRGIFAGYQSLRFTCLPASLQIIDRGASPHSKVFQITVEQGSRNFRVLSDLLIDIECITVIHDFGIDRNVTLPAEIETLGAEIETFVLGI
jgi:hypothetical protein